MGSGLDLRDTNLYYVDSMVDAGGIFQCFDLKLIESIARGCWSAGSDNPKFAIQINQELYSVGYLPSHLLEDWE